MSFWRSGTGSVGSARAAGRAARGDARASERARADASRGRATRAYVAEPAGAEGPPRARAGERRARASAQVHFEQEAVRLEILEGLHDDLRPLRLLRALLALHRVGGRVARLRSSSWVTEVCGRYPRYRPLRVCRRLSWKCENVSGAPPSAARWRAAGAAAAATIFVAVFVAISKDRAAARLRERARPAGRDDRARDEPAVEVGLRAPARHGELRERARDGAAARPRERPASAARPPAHARGRAAHVGRRVLARLARVRTARTFPPLSRAAGSCSRARRGGSTATSSSPAASSSSSRRSTARPRGSLFRARPRPVDGRDGRAHGRHQAVPQPLRRPLPRVALQESDDGAPSAARAVPPQIVLSMNLLRARRRPRPRAAVRDRDRARPGRLRRPAAARRGAARRAARLGRRRPRRPRRRRRRRRRRRTRARRAARRRRRRRERDARAGGGPCAARAATRRRRGRNRPRSETQRPPPTRPNYTYKTRISHYGGGAIGARGRSGNRARGAALMAEEREVADGAHVDRAPAAAGRHALIPPVQPLAAVLGARAGRPATPSRSRG